VNGWAHLIKRVYQFLLVFYPPEFRAEFGEEMYAVFSTAMTEAQSSGIDKFWKLIWQELREGFISVFREHLWVGRNKMTNQDEPKPLGRGELFAALALFLFLPLAYFLVDVVGRPPQWLDYIMAFVFFGGLLAAFFLAIARGLPRWSPPYLGFILMMGILLSQYDRIWGWIYPYFIQSFGPRSYWSLPVRISYVGIFEFIILFSILLSAVILVNLLRLLPYTRTLWQRIRTDWTQLSFMFYGGLVFAILVAFDEYHHGGIWKLIASLFLALGAWLYFRAKGKKQRILALVGGATGAMWTVALAKWVLIPLQQWPTGYPVAPSETTRWVETASAVVGWVWILLILITPALVKLLPSFPPNNFQEEIAPT